MTTAAASAKKHVFTPIEKKTFLDILKKYSSIIENKETDGASLANKKEAWNRVVAQYNASPFVTAQVTITQLRRLWMNLKQRQRVALTKERQYRMATGGGPYTSGADIDPEVSVLAPALIVGVSEAIDSDTLDEEMYTADPDSLSPSSTSVFTIPYLPISSSHPPIPTPSPPIPTPSPPLPTPSPPIPTPSPPIPTLYPPIPTPSLLRNKNSILQKEFEERNKRANEIHKLDLDLLKEKIREAKAKADLAELLLQKQNHPSDN